eukprot:5694099-Pleurochrysis_carterae.AAC.1
MGSCKLLAWKLHFGAEAFSSYSVQVSAVAICHFHDLLAASLASITRAPAYVSALHAQSQFGPLCVRVGASALFSCLQPILLQVALLYSLRLWYLHVTYSGTQ